MKRILIMALLAVAASSPSITYAGTPISHSELPKNAQTFLNTHFSDDNVRKAEMERGYRGNEYEVDLMSGAEIDFRDNGDWSEVKAARGKAVPSAIIPSAILKYVTSNFGDLKIIEIARKRGGYEVELSNGTELKLTEDAKPMPARPKRTRP